MAKKKTAEPVVEYGVYQCGGGPHSPFNYTVCRRLSDAATWCDKTLEEAKEHAIAANVEEYADQKAHMKACLDVFDKNTVHDFEMPEYMNPAKFRCGEKVYIAHGEVANMDARKGVIIGIQWDTILKTWEYSVTFKGHKLHSFQEGKGPLLDITAYAIEENVYSLEQKSEARSVVAKAVTECNKWWRRFNAKLSKLKEGDLKPGQLVE